MISLSKGVCASDQSSSDESADMKNHETSQQAENEDVTAIPPAKLGERVQRGIGQQRNVGLEYMEALGYSKSEYHWTLKNIWGNIRPTER